MRKKFGSASPWRQLGYALVVLTLLTNNFPGFPAPTLAAPQAAVPQQQPAETETRPTKEKAENTTPDISAATPVPTVSGALLGSPVTFSNSTLITISDNSRANPYPSTITAQGITTTINGLTVNLNGLSHTYPNDIDMLLVGPGGQKSILMSDVGGTTGISNYTLTFDDTASSVLTNTTSPINGGTYKPSDNTGFGGSATDFFTSTAPGSPYSVTLSVFNNTLPNGDWKLYIMDDVGGDFGSIANGWSLTFYLKVSTAMPNAGNSQSSWQTYPYATLLQAIVRDENSTPLSGQLVTFTAPLSGASGTFAGGSNIFTGTTDASGLVTATTFTANATPGSFNVTIQAETAIYNGSFLLTNLNSGSPANLAITNGNNQSTLISTAFSQNLAVSVKDSSGNLVANAPVVFTTPTSGASGLFLNSNAYTVTTNSSGIVTATVLVANNIAGSYNVTATVSGFGVSTLFTLTNSPGDPIQFESSGYTIAENGGTAVMTLTRSSNNGGEIYANLEINNLTASEADYSSSGTSYVVDKGFNPGTGTTNSKETYKVITLPDGKILLAGALISYNGTPVTGVTRLNSNGSLDNSFLSIGAGTDGTVHGMVRQPDGKILIAGGNFTKYNGVARNRIARLNSDGSLDTSFDPGQGPGDSIFRLAVQPDGKIIIGGNFLTYAGVTRNRIARLNSDGSLDTSFAASGLGADSTVWSIALQPDGKIIIGGNFATYAGAAANRIARLNSDGSLDTSFTAQTVGANNVVWDLALQPDGKIIAAGDFTTYNGVTVGRIVRLNSADGSRDSSFLGGGSGANGTIRALAYQKDGKLLFGGDFSTINGTTSLPKVGRLNSDGSLDATFVAGGSGPNSLVWSIASYTNNSFVVGGDLTTYDSLSRNHIARAGNLQVYWPAGDTTPKTITLTIVNDNLAETDEQLTVSVATVSPYGLAGSVATATLTIKDDDTISFVPGSGGGQSAVVSTTFSSPLAVALLNSLNQPVAGVVVTFTAPTTGASGSFAGGSNIFTGTTGTDGIVTTTLFSANAISGSYQVVVSATVATASAIFTLTNLPECNPQVVTSPSDNGQATICGTFSYALAQTGSGTITFALTGGGNTITFTGSLTPTLKPGVAIDGGTNGAVLNGNGVAGDGLRLGGNNQLTNLTIRSFSGRELLATVSSAANWLLKVKALN